jgi:adenosine deaminase
MSVTKLVHNLPKAELHIHIEGSLEPELLFSLAARNKAKLEFQSVDAIKDAYVFSNLQEFLDIYYVGMNVLQTEDDFFDLADAYFRKAAADNVRHIEAFFDPQAHTARGIPLEVVVAGFNAAINQANERGTTVYLIPCFLRHLPAKEAMSTLDALEPLLNNFHGVGLDSSEVGFPPDLFTEVFAKAKALGLKLVAHAGEEGPPEYIWQALDNLHVDRIDHGNRAMEDEHLMQRLVDDAMALTVCPLSNLKLGVTSDLSDHPLPQMLERGLLATVNSDDPAYFGGYVNDNYIQVAEATNLGAQDMITLARNSFTASFLPESDKKEWITEIEAATLSYELDRRNQYS